MIRSKKIYKTATLVSLSILAIFSLSSFAAVYKWTDKDGKVHYSDKPFDENSQEIKMNAAPSAKEVLQAKEKASILVKNNQIAREKAQENAQKREIANQKEQAAANELAKKCEQAEIAIRGLGRGVSTSMIDADGNRTYLSDDERSEKIEELQKAMKEFCGNERK